VARVGVLSMARLLTVVNAAIKSAITRIGTSEHASPFLDNILPILRGMLSATCDFVSAISAKQGLFDLATVAASIDADFASSTETLVARSWAFVFTAGHKITTDLTTAPAILIVGVGTSAGRLMLAAETRLCRTHVGTGRTRAGMTGQLTRMRTLANSLSTTGVSARVWWQASDCAWFNLFLTPTGVRLGQGVLRKVATRTSPLARRRNLSVFSALLLGSGGPLILRPLLDTGHVEDGPASVA
jgi:hypothetical protein